MTSPPPVPVVIDGGDRACVALLLELRARICDLPAGTVVHLIAWDPAASIDLPAWCHLTGHTYLGSIRAATPPLVQAAGFQIIETERLKAGTVERICAVKPALPVSVSDRNRHVVGGGPDLGVPESAPCPR